MRERKVGSRWEEERREFFENRGWGLEEAERRRGEKEEWIGEMERVDLEKQKEDRWKRIGKSKFNR